MTVDCTGLRTLLGLATPGPWEHSDQGVYGVSIQAPSGSVAQWDDLPLSEEDAALITATINALPALLDEIERLRAFGEKVNVIRNSIIGLQKINWSEHIYPLVAALEAAGFPGEDYDTARARIGTLLERTRVAERSTKLWKGLARRLLNRIKEQAIRATLAAQGVIGAARAECAQFTFPDEDRPKLFAALLAYDAVVTKIAEGK